MEFEWDVAIVGAGMGGAAVGYALAKAGRRVLFIEKGFSQFSQDEDDPDTFDETMRLRNGRWPQQISGMVDNQSVRFFPALGCGAGGSTLLYAAALERFSPGDFQATDELGEPAWPIDYEGLEPFYRLAERLLQVRGSQDPLQPEADVIDPPVMTRCDQYFFDSVQSNGMHPYRVHTACRYVEDCSQCGGAICHKSCKQDARHAFIEPALATGNAMIVDQCNVEKIEAGKGEVTELLCRRNGKALTFTAKRYVLAAGALSTPLLLLNSRNELWPNGVANTSDLVGRNLMFHVSDFFAVWPRGRMRVSTPGKSIAFRDFYEYQGLKFGVIQSTGLTATSRNILHFLKSIIDRQGWIWLKPLKPLMRIPAAIGAFISGKATIFASILEDMPYPENRVKPNPQEPDRIFFEYTVHAELRQRIKAFRRLYRQAFKRHRMMVLGSEVNLNFGHACGTCRFGTDPSTAVLDVNNRTYDLPNLYIVDASFFPTSGGANPSLTIAANALRVGAYIAEELATKICV
ncbi:GMC oxidoreductase [Rhizobium terrae]|uniref:GMC oxidoreductase n=1 Tax=Rhizobium terrae TaxID=2171756 RepID=UPI000E3D6186|nr:GMC family oxidoreductase [Rhizobium terrae]